MPRRVLETLRTWLERLVACERLPFELRMRFWWRLHERIAEVSDTFAHGRSWALPRRCERW